MANREQEPVSVSVFTSEQCHELRARGYYIFGLTGKSLLRLREVGYKVRSPFYFDTSFEANTSMLTEVAINPKKLFLPDSIGISLKEQLVLVEVFGRQIGSEVSGITAILGSVADYAELVYSHVEPCVQRLFESSFYFTGTSTRVRNNRDAVVGSFFFSPNSVRLGFQPLDKRYPLMGAAPLVLPALAIGAVSTGKSVR